MSASRWVHLDVLEIKKETDNAYLIVLDDDDRSEHWIPKSQVSDPDDYAEGDEDLVMSVTEWIANERGISE